MANVGTYKIENTNYVKLSTITGVNYNPALTYRMQNLGEEFYIRIGTEGEGEIIKPLEKFYYKTDADDLYIKPAFVNSTKEKKINICICEHIGNCEV